MKEVVLHIGTQKTGTTSIQKCFKINRKLLASKNIFSPKTLDIGNGHHRWITAISNNEKYVDAFIANQQFKTTDDRRKKIEQKTNEFIKEVKDGENGKWIISCEHAQSELKTKEEIQRLKNILEKLFEKITIILYIRKPISSTISMWSTDIKYGARYSEMPDPTKPFFENIVNHKKTLEKWISIFSKKQILVRRFQSKDFRNGSLIEDFFYAAGIEFKKDYVMPEKENQSLSFLGIKSLGYINEFIPFFKKDEEYIHGVSRNKERSILMHYIEKFTSKDQKYLPRKEMYFKYEKYYEDSSEWVRKEFFPEDSTLWNTSGKEEYQDDIYPKINASEQMLLNIIIRLWKERMHLISKNSS
tara:strand:+ start:455 stop:1528 length:1074 start_codon:yes stop_codon:yes gene_type:complete